MAGHQTAMDARLEVDIKKIEEKYAKSPNTSWDTVRLILLVKIWKLLNKQEEGRG